MRDTQFTFIEAPIHQGQKHYGVSLGSSFIRQSLIDQNFDFTNVFLKAKQQFGRVNLEAYEQLSYLVEIEARKENLIFTAGGDHSLSLGSIQGLLRVNPDLKVIWIDAHGDINTRNTSTTGSFHGMPLSFLLGADKLQGEIWIENFIKPENLIYFGVRDLDPEEKLFLERHQIRHYSVENINSRGVSEVIAEISSAVQGSQVHFSVDSDAFDPAIAPSTGVPVAGGITYSCAYKLIKSVLAVAQVKSYEYVELNPQIFTNQFDVFNTAQIGIDLFSLILKNFNQRTEIKYGRNDRQRHSTKPNLLHTYF